MQSAGKGPACPFDVALAELNVAEIPGRGSNKRIDEYLSTVGLSDDATPWCAAFVNWVLEEAGEAGTGAANARSYEKWGAPVDRSAAKRGDIAVLKRGTSAWQGHVAFIDYFFTDASGKQLVRLLGGNQGNRVSFADFEVDDLLAIRRVKRASDSTTVAAGTGAIAATVAREAVGAADVPPFTTETIAAQGLDQVHQIVPLVPNDILKAALGVIAAALTLYIIAERLRRLRKSGI